MRSVKDADAEPGSPVAPRTHIANPIPSDHFSDDEIASAKTRLQAAMWRGVGLVRDEAGLGQTMAVINELYAKFGHPGPRRNAIELANMIECAWLITRASLERHESRGAHFRRDFPATREDWRHHLLLSGDRDNLVISEVEVK